MKKSYLWSAKGIVVGRSWYGKRGYYDARPIAADTKEELYSRVWEAIEDGSIDGGFGFQEVLGAILWVNCQTTIEVDGVSYYRNDGDYEVFGDINEEDIKFFLEGFYYEDYRRYIV